MLVLCLGVLVSGCAVPSGPVTGPSTASAGAPTSAYATFAEVAGRVEPVAERICRSETRGVNCDFQIVIDRRANQPPNAFQSLTESGRPVLTVTSTLIADMQNPDELAFVMSHEAAHHIQGHLARQQENAAAGAVIFAGLATLTGGTQADVQSALELGGAVGARSYSKEFELEADSLGTVIAYNAGYDPLLGAAYFQRLPDPGNRFLGTHPPNAARVEVVKLTLGRL